MRFLHPLRTLFLLASALLSAAGCRTAQPAAPALAAPNAVQPHTDKRAASDLFAEFGGEHALLQTAAFLYRWVLDENDFKRRDADLQGQLWIRRIQTLTDPNDNSRFLELVFPAMGIAVNLKKTDYRIPELKLDVRSDGYRVVRISRNAYTAGDAGDYYRFDFSPEALNDRLFQERLNAVFPDEALFSRMRERVAREIADLEVPPAGKVSHTVYFAPVNSVANELWTFWAEGKLLFRFSSDIDFTNAGVWAQDSLNVTVYDAVRQTVVSHEERPGDSRFLTRDQVGRALYNCIVLGRALTLEPPRPAPAP